MKLRHALSALAISADLPFCDEHDEYHLSSPDGSLKPELAGSRQARAFAERLAPLLLTEDRIFLGPALLDAATPQQQRAVLERYAAPDAAIDNHLEALEQARRLKLAPKALRARLRTSFTGQLASL